MQQSGDDPAVLAVLGSLNMDIVISAEHLPRRGETVPARGVARHPGGKGANQAAAAALSGGRVGMIGAVGQDAFGEALLSTLRACGVDVRHVQALENAATGTAYVVVEASGENQILVHGGANLAVSPALAEALPGAAVRLAQLETPLDAVAAFLRQGGLRLLNAAPFVEGARDLLSEVDILIVNETELADCARAPQPVSERGAVEALARGLIRRPDQWVVVTLGAQGALAVGAEQTVVTPGRPARVVDTTGAGDCFCGVLAASLAAGRTLAAGLERANAAASISVGRVGAVSSLPGAEEIDAVLAEGAPAR